MEAGRRQLILGLAALFTTPMACRGAPQGLGKGARLVTLGSALTEIVHALGAFQHLVGVDGSSAYPAEAKKLPKVGFYRAFSVEGVLGLEPTLVLLTDESGPLAAVQQLQQSGIATVVVPGAKTAARAKARILHVGKRLGLEVKAKELVAKVERELQRAAEVSKAAGARPRAMFVYARKGAFSVAGRGTSADEMLRLAGAENAVQSFEGFHRISTESVIAAAPEVLVMTTHGADDPAARAAVLELPGVTLTPAGRSRRVVVMDDVLLLGFGPRLGQAAEKLALALREVKAP